MVIYGLAQWQVNSETSSTEVVLKLKPTLLEQITDVRWGIPVMVKYIYALKIYATAAQVLICREQIE